MICVPITSAYDPTDDNNSYIELYLLLLGFALPSWVSCAEILVSNMRISGLSSVDQEVTKVYLTSEFTKTNQLLTICAAVKLIFTKAHIGVTGMGVCLKGPRVEVNVEIHASLHSHL